ncbi:MULTISPECIES: hypothetical protein [unclassified Streptomyces]|uniref:hypothetical protein n=1 Tax=unclassified Streptomyces TaxID=2593676 RepID=UPI002DDC1A52|nr:MULTISPECIES: hypothetical protein [unclassified Streptomyces]WSA95362.1 hypothetical protein OIE63_30235 [Streptomyces sp. NBC_01795]WSB79780.1 hypothetical protein OHB04_31345 [Streptomyces sp. NBC_01775]WSS12013.1 hypothetical protein OG533_08865 [Streptomyces sp. NBC_01186]WSS40727.1 hypothetical protein OG220_09025 [Streptomyces sp. NBC_01187]
MSGLSAILIFVGLFLAGGAVSFWKQKLPTGVIVLLGLGSALALLAGILRLEWWS